MVEELPRGTADTESPHQLRYSVSLVKQGKHQFYTLTMPSEVLAATCTVTTRKEDPRQGFQRELDEKRALDIARYIDDGGSNGVWLSAIRNEINYQQKYETWFPLHRKCPSLEALNCNVYSESSSIRLDNSKSRRPILAFVNITKYIANLSIEVANYVANRSTIGGAFGQKWRRFQEQIG